MTKIKDDYDVVVIGGGIGGLTCGALLARSRMRVLVAEQSSKPGGCCSSFEHNGYIFDNGLSFLTGCEIGGSIYQTLEELGLWGYIEFVKIEPAIRVIGSDYDFSIRSAESLEDRLVSIFPMEATTIRKFIAECRTMATEMDKSLTAPPDSMNILQKILSYIPLLLGHGRIKRYGGRSSQETIARFFEDPKLRSILLTSIPYPSPGATASLLMSMLGTREGAYYPKGGAQALAEVLVDGLRKHEGVLALDTMVDKIIIEGKRAAGVMLRGGRKVLSQYVVSNVDAKQTFFRLVGEEHLTPRFRRELNESRLSNSAFLVSLGVNLNIRAMGFDGATIVYNPSDQIDELFGTDPEKCMLIIEIHSISDPSFAPGSTAAIQLIMMSPYDAVGDWEAEQEAIADKLIASAEKVIPGLSNNVLFKHIANPLTIEKATSNSQGSPGWYPVPGSKPRKQKTPIKNLYQAGHWTFPGSGVPQVVTSGRNAAQLILRGNKTQGKVITYANL